MFPPNLPAHAYDAANFAESIARAYAAADGSGKDLFVAYAGLISARDKVLAAECLIALEAALHSSGGLRPALTA
jgi:hypothetical protein